MRSQPTLTDTLYMISGRVATFAFVTTAMIAFQNCSEPVPIDSSTSSSSSASDYILLTSTPATQTVALGATIRMSLTATSLKNRTLTYMWKKDGVAISSAILNTIAITSATKLNEGFYTVVISDGIRALETDPVWVQVGADSTSAGTVSISTQPSAMTTTAGSVAYFEVIASDSLAKTLTYQWYFNGAALSGQTAAQLYITNITKAANTGYYYVNVSNGTTTLKSATVSLTIDSSTMTCASGTLYNSHCYVVYGTAATWTNAVTQCSLAGGYLAKVTTYSESLFIANLAGQTVWIGASDSIIEGTFLWRDGTQLTYSLWESGQPDNSSSNEDCVQIKSTGYWNDAVCTTALPYVCEIE